MNEINLLPKANVGPQKQERMASMLRRISFVLLFATASIAISLFVLVISSPLQQVQQQENDYLSAMDKSKVKISKNVIIQERLNSTGKILRDRNHYEKFTGAVLQVLPSSLVITSIEIDQKEMQIIGESRSLDSINTYLNALVLMQTKKELIQSVVLKSLSSQSEDGKYVFTIQLTFL